MNKTQEKLLQILQRFDALCKKNDVKYYLGGGSALGAIRHKGFLPWDDDVDIYISRKEYEKIVALKDTFFPDDLKMVTTEDYPYYGNSITRIVDVNSTAFTRPRLVDGTPKGEFIELFILDPMPLDESLHEEWLKKHCIYCELLDLYFVVAGQRTHMYTDEKLYNQYLEKAKKSGPLAVIKELEKELFSIEESDSKKYCLRWGDIKIVYDIDWFGDMKYVPFEDIELPVAQLAERVALTDYGATWMYIPDENHQIVHNIMESMSIPYTNVISDYEKMIDVNKVRNNFAELKILKANKYYYEKSILDKKLALKNAQVLANLKRNLPSLEHLDALVEAHNAEAIRDAFYIWYHVQFQRYYFNVQGIAPIDEHLVAIALYPMLMEGQYSTIERYLLLRKKKLGLSSELEDILNYVSLIKNVYLAIDLKNYDSILAAYKELDDSNYIYKNRQYDYRKFTILSKRLTKSEDFNVLIEECDRLLEEYPQYGEIMSMKADLLHEQGRNTEAIALYKMALENTRHGFIVMHINEVLKSLEG